VPHSPPVSTGHQPPLSSSCRVRSASAVTASCVSHTRAYATWSLSETRSSYRPSSWSPERAPRRGLFGRDDSDALASNAGDEHSPEKHDQRGDRTGSSSDAPCSLLCVRRTHGDHRPRVRARRYRRFALKLPRDVANCKEPFIVDCLPLTVPRKVALSFCAFSVRAMSNDHVTCRSWAVPTTAMPSGPFGGRHDPVNLSSYCSKAHTSSIR
jgi:hypothetical protein